jgi:hypothetical protein
MEINFLSISDIDLYSKIIYIETKHRFEESNFWYTKESLIPKCSNKFITIVKCYSNAS